MGGLLCNLHKVRSERRSKRQLPGRQTRHRCLVQGTSSVRVCISWSTSDRLVRTLLSSFDSFFSFRDRRLLLTGLPLPLFYLYHSSIGPRPVPFPQDSEWFRLPPKRQQNVRHTGGPVRRPLGVRTVKTWRGLDRVVLPLVERSYSRHLTVPTNPHRANPHPRSHVP